MQQLQFVELDEGGRLVLTDDDGSQYAVRVDDRLRAALRPRSRQPEQGVSGRRAASPRDVQAMIRAGQPAEDVASSTGWDLERVRRFEGPVLAEREHVVGLAQRAPVRASGRTDGSHTLDRRVRERLQSRGVDLTAVSWDAARGEAHEPWTVIVAFGAGGRERRAAWHYDVRARSVEALDDEARWLSEDEQALPGGLSGHPLLGGHGEDEAAAGLMATMRERRQRRGRRSQPASRAGADDPGHLPGQRDMPDEVLPLEDLPYDPDTMGDPPAAHPRGSAAEAPAPVGLEDEQVEDAVSVEPEPEVLEEPDVAETSETPEVVLEPEPEPEPVSPEEAKRAVGRGRGRKRRRLRLPSVAPAQDDLDDEPEGSFARTRHDPREVTFDEFFGVEDEDDLEPEIEREPQVRERVVEESVVDDVTAEDPVDDEPVEDEVVEDEVVEPLVDDEPEQEAEAEIEPESEAGQPVGEPEADAAPEDDTAAEATAADEAAADEVAEEPASKPSGRKGRTSVPSWDDIMFGSRPPRD
ncbi:putative DNA-binding protein [Serinicoccus hydrothermalis]|uniref:Putative DNA-binding protein n=1 Tax=Serinicoccus hydrothermalis TaxID=1758689 RepID=A0A1B1N970_9MICO|nr:septation protein SepH [Serinicoccus hydrothermalis]ANS77990.1 putative DNA-binding protein [Serinicoccus hydrothermalis]